MRRSAYSRMSARQFQSAPGLEAGRCLQPPPQPNARRVFQSAPGLEAGRCADLPSAKLTVPRVSIRARPRGRAMPKSTGHGTRAGAFQSAPGLEAGRCGAAFEALDQQLAMFQSAPGLEAGRCPDPSK